MHFEVKDCALIGIATGREAHTLRELRDGIGAVEAGSIYHHFWGCLLAPQFREREYNNDFAAWAWHAAHDRALAERLAIVDPIAFDDLEALRRELVDVIDDHLYASGYLPWLRASAPFDFIRSQIVVFDTGRHAGSPEELGMLLPELSDGSVFYHFIDARRRTPDGIDDLRAWLAQRPEDHRRTRAQLADVDPYFTTLGELRERLTEIFASCGDGSRAASDSRERP